MENLTRIEKEAQEHRKLAQHEKEVAQKLKISASVEIKKSKARETLMKIEYKLADIKKDLAEKRNILVKEKTEIKKNQILDFSEEELKIEKDYAIYNEKIAKNQKEITNINEEILYLKEIIEKDKNP